MDTYNLQEFLSQLTQKPQKQTQRKIELCELCGLVPADKKNSHIVPKFFSKRMLSNSPKKVYSFKSTPDFSRPEMGIEQDTMKEDHLLCSGCEGYFSILETDFCNNIHEKIRDFNSLDPIVDTTIAGRKRKIINTVNKDISYLLIYSIIFRCHISRHTTFSTFNLDDESFKVLRNELNKYRNKKRKKIIELISRQALEHILEFYLAVPEHFNKSTSNLIFQSIIPSRPDIYYLILGEYRLMFSFEKALSIGGINNIQKDSLVVEIISNTEWENIYNKNIDDISKIFQSRREIDQKD